MTEKPKNNHLRSGRLRRFLSLKWKALLFFSLVLIAINASFPLLSYINLTRQFDARRVMAHQQHALAFEGILEQTSQRLVQLGGIIPSLKGMEKALSTGGEKEIVAAFGNHWPLWQLDTGISTARFYSERGQELAAWESLEATETQDPAFVSMNEAVRKKEAPVTALSCNKVCSEYVMIPVLSSGRNTGAILLGTSLADVILSFRKISGVDTGIMIDKRKDEQPAANASKSISSWNSELIALTNMDRTIPLLKKTAQEAPSIDTVKRGRKIDFDNRIYELRLIPLQGMVHAGSGHIVIIDDISEPLSEIRAATQQSMWAGLIGLFISEGLLLVFLSAPMKRLSRIATTLPLLAQNAYRDFRQAAVKRKQVWVTDEIDTLGETAITLSFQLENLDEEVKKRTQSLADRMEELTSEKAFISNLLDTARVIILTQNKNGKVITFNRYGSNLTGYSLSELISKPFLDLLSGADLSPELSEGLLQIGLGQRNHFSHESVLTCKNGSKRYIVWFHSRIERKGEGKAAVLSVGLDFTERKQAETRLAWLADHDPLTGLYNRRRFQKELNRVLDESNRFNQKGALLFFDLDQFKYVNDTRGHHSGDALLQVVAKRLSQLVRPTDFISRLGGDEFAFVISKTDRKGAIKMAEKISKNLNDIEIPYLEHRYKVSASIGIALFPNHGNSLQALLSNADLAMYQAKDRAPGRCHVYSSREPIREKMQKHAYWEDRIKQALDKDGFVIHYQPVMRVSKGSISFHEALIRMRNKDDSLISPGVFIPIAEACGLIHSIDHLVLKKVISTQASLAQKGVHATFTINLSGHAMNDRALLPLLRKTLKQTGADARAIIFEITETAAVSDLRAACKLMLEIKSLGCRFALDDYGMGFSSFNYMKQLPVDFVKIGDTFIKGLTTQTDDQIFVKSLSEVTRHLEKKTIAEGVESHETLALLQEYAVDFAQGYYVGKPAPMIV
ncbi:MAG: EAL domain-containing protein [Nitrospiria bacterium]